MLLSVGGESDTEAEISVIIPAHNEERHIGAVLRAILPLSSILNVELIVVDVNSTDNTKSIARSLGASVISVDQASPGHARNIGVSASTSELLAFVDGDVVVTQNWINAVVDLVKCSDAFGGALRGAPYMIREDGGWLEKHWFSLDGQRLPGYINGGNILIAREDFNRLGGFDECLDTGEDVDFSLRARTVGLEVVVDRRFEAIHYGYPSSWFDFLVREAWHGSGDASSINAFIGSRVAQAAIINFFLLVSVFWSAALGMFWVSGALLLSVLMLSASFSARRWGIKSGSMKIAYGIPVAFVYLIGRAIGLVLPGDLLMSLRNRQKGQRECD